MEKWFEVWGSRFDDTIMLKRLDVMNQEKGHKKLDVYQLAHQLAVSVHKMTVSLPTLERYEEGSQIRRSGKSISSNIVEGYALRRYKAEFVHYLFRAYGSAEETIVCAMNTTDWLENSFDTSKRLTTHLRSLSL